MRYLGLTSLWLDFAGGQQRLLMLRQVKRFTIAPSSSNDRMETGGMGSCEGCAEG